MVASPFDLPLSSIGNTLHQPTRNASEHVIEIHAGPGMEVQVPESVVAPSTSPSHEVSNNPVNVPRSHDTIVSASVLLPPSVEIASHDHDQAEEEDPNED